MQPIMSLAQTPQLNMDRLLNQLVCEVCTEVMYHPVTLGCQHTFCMACVVACKDRTCPVCRCKFVMPRDYNRLIDNMVQLFYIDDWTTLHEEERERHEALSARERAAEQMRREIYDSVMAEQPSQIIQAPMAILTSPIPIASIVCSALTIDSAVTISLWLCCALSSNAVLGQLATWMFINWVGWNLLIRGAMWVVASKIGKNTTLNTLVDTNG